METMANTEVNKSEAPLAVSAADQANNVVSLAPQDSGAAIETQCDGGVCMLTWKPKRPSATAA